MNFDYDFIEKLAKLLNKNSLTEITLEDGDKAVSVKREGTRYIDAAPLKALAQPEALSEPKKEEAAKSEPENKAKPVTSPMVGAYYNAPSPGAKPFVKVGDIVSAGQVVCIIEAMKLMNEIETEVSGKITQICVENGQSVEYGQVLMYVE